MKKEDIDALELRDYEIILVRWNDIETHYEKSYEDEVSSAPSASIGWFDYVDDNNLVIIIEFRRDEADKQAIPLGCVTGITVLKSGGARDDNCCG